MAALPRPLSLSDSGVGPPFLALLGDVGSCACACGCPGAASCATAACGGGGLCGILALEFLVHAVDAEEVLAAEGVFHGGFVFGVDVEAFGYAVGGDFDGVGVFGLQRAVGEGGGEEVDDG